MSTHSPNQLAQILADQDSDALCVVPGIGKKTAARLIVELQSKIDSASIPLKNNEPSGEGISSQDSGLRDVRDALSGLGYAKEEIQIAMRDLPSNTEPSLLLKFALQKLAAVT